jgi:hypothetical protein
MAIYRGLLPADDFTVMPRHWFRDHRLSGKAKGYMAYIATHSEGYRLTIEQLIAEMRDGRDAVYAGLEELVKYHYLRRTQARDGGKFGEVDYHFDEAAYDQQYERKWQRRDGSPASGKTVSGKPGSGPDQEEREPAASGETGSGEAASGEPATKEEKSLGTKGEEEHPPTPHEDELTAADGAADGGEDSSTDPDQERRSMLNAAVAAVRAVRPAWTTDAIAAAMRQALEQGHPVETVVAGIHRLAADQGTRYPGRLPASLALAAPAVPAPRRPDPPRGDQCPKHRGWPAGNCGPCKGEAHAPVDDVVAPMPDPRGAARDLAKRARRARGVQPPGDASRRLAARTRNLPQLEAARPLDA